MDKGYKQYVERKKKKEKVWRLVNNFVGSFGEGLFTGVNVFGFIISQLFWIWLLQGFIGFFYNYLNELSEFTFADHITRTSFIGLFWLIYFLWFVITLLYKFNIRIGEERKNG